MTTKAAVKSAYITNLKARYPFYTDGSRPLEMANEAADAALEGRVRLQGDCWSLALQQCGLNQRITLRELAALPAE
jgi:hypothetical protein